MTRLLFLLLFSSVTLFAQRTPLRVNGTIVDNPNFVTGSTALIGRSGANISVAPTNIANAQIAAGAAIDVSKLSGVAPTVHTHAGEDIASGTVADARIASTITRDNEWDTTGEINAATTDDDFATLLGSQTLVNKTLTAPVLTTPTLGVATATSLGTDSFPGPGNMTFFDGSQASRTWTFSLSGATDPVLTFANNLLTISTPLALGADNIRSAAGSQVISTAPAGYFALRTANMAFAANSSSALTFSSGADGLSGQDTYISRDSAGVVKITSNGTALSGLKSGTLTLTPSTADTQAITVSGGSTTGSGTTRGGHFLHTANTSGNIDGVWTFTLVDTASGSTTKALQIFGGAAGTTSLFNVDKLGAATALGNVTASGGALSLAANFDVIFRRDAAASHQFGTDAASPTHQRLKAHDATGTDNSASHFTLSGGQSTGTGRGGALIGQTSPSGSTGSSANAYSERYHFPAKAVTLTSATATTVATIACPVAKFIGGKCTVTVFATDGTDHQARTLDFAFSAINKAGTITAGIDTPAESVAVSSGSLTVSITVVANGNALDIKVNADSSLTENTLSATVSLPSINSNDTAAVTEI